MNLGSAQVENVVFISPVSRIWKVLSAYKYGEKKCQENKEILIQGSL